ncbi:hypothetical protein ATE48_16575 [Candidatus Viadribacter manganicus]|uniref:17 kDa surface antigen n=2 Tax=Candidatus Viadribacter manganicus TaxID=1759059 RepID=A0A1B1ALL9_9PROT|nr:hypothetical protein ATE48_16575 [Candidatus Viadribacter manganicus]
MATALTTAFAQPAAAQQYRSYHDEHVATQQQCQTSRSNRTAGGAVIGGVIGALLGREVADRGVRGEGAGLGAVVGAVAGGAIGRSTANCGQVQGSYDPYTGRAAAYPSDRPYYGEQNDDLYGGPYEDGYYRNDDRDCRMGEQITRAPNGREYREEVLMCRDRDGVWRTE